MKDAKTPNGSFATNLQGTFIIQHFKESNVSLRSVIKLILCIVFNRRNKQDKKCDFASES